MRRQHLRDRVVQREPPRDLLEDLAHWHLVALRLLDALLPRLGRDPRLDSP